MPDDRRGGRTSGGGPLGLLRFGTGALEDLLPAIEEGGMGMAEDTMMMEDEEVRGGRVSDCAGFVMRVVMEVMPQFGDGVETCLRFHC